MSLTDQAYQERKWGRIPALRALLSQRRVPDKYYRYSSASDNIFESLPRLLEVAILVEENQRTLQDAAAQSDVTFVAMDLASLACDLKTVADDFYRRAERISTIGVPMAEQELRRKETSVARDQEALHILHDALSALRSVSGA